MTPLDVVIDVSDAQNVINWTAVAKAGIKFAFIKATEGRTFAAKTFNRNMAAAAAAGVMCVPYDFLRPGYDSDQVAFFSRTAGLGPGKPFMLDWEGRASDTCRAADCELIGLNLQEITGREPVGYFGRPGSTPEPATAKMNGWCRDVPRYPFNNITSWETMPLRVRLAPSLYVPSGTMFWQYTDKGQVPGISAPVDRSVWLGTLDELSAWFRTGLRPTWSIAA